MTRFEQQDVLKVGDKVKIIASIFQLLDWSIPLNFEGKIVTIGNISGNIIRIESPHGYGIHKRLVKKVAM